ncbi:MAG: VacJ family lipoprotein [Halioglobus sp.]|nr:VacJ family lipoprotein [Halioglobus sp.]MCP5122053.1 VacJ family lipoprotein [Pseudomonadales bacterium]MCP5192401.1 VacJ family lipoprotein [Pseudomonadales bacterium]
MLAFTSGCSWAQEQERTRDVDPWEPVNRKIFVFNDTLDHWILTPVAKGYKFVMPDFAEQGVTNFIANIYEFNSFYNSLLQGEFLGATKAGGRLLVNSTLGLLGFFDVATPMGIAPFRADFGQTLAVWGVDSGPYVMLPVFGPRNVRSAVGYFTDTYTSIPYLVNEQTWAWTFWTVEVIDYRARLLDAEDLITGDRYIFLRDAYLQRRKAFDTRGEVDDSFSDFEQDAEDWEEF